MFNLFDCFRLKMERREEEVACWHLNNMHCHLNVNLSKSRNPFKNKFCTTEKRNYNELSNTKEKNVVLGR